MRTVENPFERYDLDPRDGISAITARLKELAEDATDDAERERIRAAWEELTLDPARRLKAALFAHPETRPPLGVPPSPSRRAARTDPGSGESIDHAIAEVHPRASRALALGAPPERAEETPPPSLDEDPLL